MAMCQPSMKCNPVHMCPKSAFQVHEDWNWSKNWLELRKGLQRCTPFFCVSVSCGIDQHSLSVISDKMQTKTAQKETQDLHPRSLKSLYNGGVSTSIAKVVIINQKSKSPLSFDHLINQSPNPDLSCLGDCLEFVPGVPVNGDDHLHPLVLRIC